MPHIGHFHVAGGRDAPGEMTSEARRARIKRPMDDKRWYVEIRQLFRHALLLSKAITTLPQYLVDFEIDMQPIYKKLAR